MTIFFASFLLQVKMAKIIWPFTKYYNMLILIKYIC